MSDIHSPENQEGLAKAAAIFGKEITLGEALFHFSYAHEEDPQRAEFKAQLRQLVIDYPLLLDALFETNRDPMNTFNPIQSLIR